MFKSTLTALALVTSLGVAGQPALANSMFDQGLQDRTAWEQWFNNLQGDYKTGAFYWAGQRSLPHPGSCQQMNADFYHGCTDAKVKLATTDALRRTEPGYKVGWNSYVATVAPIAAPEMAPAPVSQPAPVYQPAPIPTPEPIPAAVPVLTFDSAADRCAMYTRSSDNPRFLAYVVNDGTYHHIKMLGDLRANFDFDRCMNAVGYPLTDERP